MILPLITPVDGEVFNLSQMVCWKDLTPGEKDLTRQRCEVTFAGGVKRTFSGGVKRTFSGDAARVIKVSVEGELKFLPLICNYITRLGQ